MSERFSKVFSLPENLYAEGSPVLIAAGALLKDNQTGRILTQLKLQNISDKSIKAVAVKIIPFDTVGKPLGDPVDYQFLDLSSPRDAMFGQKTPISLPDASTRSFSVTVTEVIFSDNVIWTGGEAPWEEPLSKPVSLEEALQDYNLVMQYRLEYGKNCRNMFKREKDLWFCACGTLNHQEEPVCHKRECQKTASDLEAFDLDKLKSDLKERLAMERQRAEEEQAEAERIRAANKKKAQKAAMIIVPVALLLIILSVTLLPFLKKGNAYQEAVSLAANEKYAEAMEIFEELGDFRDSREQYQKLEKEAYPVRILAKYIRDTGIRQENLTLPDREEAFTGYSLDMNPELSSTSNAYVMLHADDAFPDKIWYQYHAGYTDRDGGLDLIFDLANTDAHELSVNYYCKIDGVITLPDNSSVPLAFTGSVDPVTYHKGDKIAIDDMWIVAAKSKTSGLPITDAMRASYVDTISSMVENSLPFLFNFARDHTDIATDELGFKVYSTDV